MIRRNLAWFLAGALLSCGAPAYASEDTGRAVRALERIAAALERCR